MPLRFDLLMERNKELPECNLGTSIAQNIFLIASTRFQEHRFDEHYGCIIWEKDFELITNPLAWQEDVNKSITETLNHYESRLENINVVTLITEEPFQHPVTKVRSIKKRVTINVTGTIKSTGEAFAYSPKMFISPVSID